MIKSMTGFATATHEDDRSSMSVSVRTVNHRYLDVQMRIPSSLAAMEADVRGLVAKSIARGRVELALTVQLRQAPVVEVELNEQFGRALEAALERARTWGLVAGALTPGDLLRLPQAITIRERPVGEAGASEVVIADALRLVARALGDLDDMRIREGGHLRADLDRRKASVADLAERIVAAADEGRRLMERRLNDRVAELRSALQADEVLVAQEIVRTAARSDISEETSRLRGHVDHWAVLSNGAEPCGRKLDFLLQEMNREINTMGSKADGPRVSELIIAAKAELEKMREQVQNAE